MRRTVSESLKKKIAGRQYFKCANNPMVNLRTLEKYKCPLWKLNDINRGSFDESCYEIDHIYEFAETGDDSENNLQALCLSCHRVKTKEYMRSKNIKTRNEKNKESNISLPKDDDTEIECNDETDEVEDINKVLWNMMKDYACVNCDKRFTSSNGLAYHTKKNVCERMGRYVCEYCNKELSSSYSLYRHKTNSCKRKLASESDNKSDDTDDIDKLEILKKFSEMEERMKKLESENNMLKSGNVNKSINNDTIYNVDGNINNNTMNITVNVVPFGKEDISKNRPKRSIESI